MAKPLGYTRFPDWQNGFVVLSVVNGVPPEIVSYRNGSLYFRNYEWKFTQKELRQIEIDIKLLPQLVHRNHRHNFLHWNGLQDVIQHQNACDIQVEILTKEIDTLESNFNDLLFKLSG